MPSFSDEQIEAWRVERVDEALYARGLDARGRTILEEEQAHLEAQITAQAEHLRLLREDLRRVRRKLRNNP